MGSENCSLRDSNSSSRSSSKQVQVYTGISGEVPSEKYNQSISEGVLSIKEMVELFEVVNSSGVPNFKKCRIRVPGSKNFDMSSTNFLNLIVPKSKTYLIIILNFDFENNLPR